MEKMNIWSLGCVQSGYNIFTNEKPETPGAEASRVVNSAEKGK